MDGVQRTRVGTIVLCGSLQRVTDIEMTRVSFKGAVRAGKIAVPCRSKLALSKKNINRFWLATTAYLEMM